MGKRVNALKEILFPFIMAAVTIALVVLLWALLCIESRLPSYSLPKPRIDSLSCGQKRKRIQQPLRPAI